MVRIRLARQRPREKKLVERLKRLKFGTSHPQKQKGKSTNAPAPGKDSGTKYAQKHRPNLANYANRMMRLLQEVKSDASFSAHVKERPANVPVWLLSAAELPEFDKHSKEIAIQWFEVGYSALRWASNEKVEKLRGLGEAGISTRRAFTGEVEEQVTIKAAKPWAKDNRPAPTTVEKGLDDANTQAALKSWRNGCKSRLKETFLAKFFEPEKG